MKKILLPMAFTLVTSSIFSQYAPIFKSSEILTCPDDNHPHVIDLGLPSGTKWACCNIDAKKPSEYGGYYAWGETDEKEMYNLDAYSFFRKSTGDYYCVGIAKDSTNIAKSKFDVAHLKWREGWHMPTRSQISELTNRNYCHVRGAIVDGVYGCLIIGCNHNKLFLPLCGYKSKLETKEQGKDCLYWSGTNHWVYGRRGPYSLIFDGTLKLQCENFYYGGSIRAVYE